MRSLLSLAVVVTLGGFLLPAAARSAEAPFPLVDAVECRPRGGLPNVFARLSAGEEVRVAYIGGSITAANGWRPQTTAWLKQRFPKATIVETNAAIGGTGSDLGVFRFGHDVLTHRPHFIFVEFAVNDSGASPEQIQRCMEGMVRQAWAADPATDICFVYTLTDGMVPTLQQGKFVRSASAMERVADHYAIPSIHMGLEVARLAKEGTLVLKSPAPKTDAEKAAMKDKILFSTDGVHPLADTGHRLYTEAVSRSVEQMRGAAAKAGPHALPAPLMADNYEKAKLVPLSKAKLSAGWEKLDPAKHKIAKNFARFEPEMYMGKPGETIALRFKGTLVGVYDLLGPDCGEVEVKVDDAKPVPVLRFDPYSTYHRMGSFIAKRDLPDAVHTVEFRVGARVPDKAAILAKRNEKIDDPKRFEATHWYAGWIMLVGDVAE